MKPAPSTEDGVLRGPKTSYEELQENLGRWVFRRLRQYGDKVAQIYPELGGLTFSFNQLAQRAACVSKALSARGLVAGDVLVTMVGVVPHFTPLMMGCLMRKVTLAPLNPGCDVNDLKRMISETLQPRILIAETEAVALVRSACPDLEVVELGEVDRWFEDASTSADEPLDDLSPADDDARWLNAAAIVMCSSGTTGVPKGVMLSHRSLHHQVCVSRELGIVVSEDTVVHYTPVFWLSAVAVSLFCIDVGCKFIALPRFDAVLVARTIQEYKATFVFMAPNALVSLCKTRGALGYDLSSLRSLVVGGATMDALTQKMAIETLGATIQQWYGMTEIMLVVASTSGDQTPVGSAGKLMPNVEAKVVEPDSRRVLGSNCEGELCFRAPTVTPGYYRRPDATAEAMDADGWFHSGDIGYYDQQGYFYITDRLKDLIKFQGHHISPSELEAILQNHKAVKEACVVGIPSELDQEHPRAYVILQPGATATEDELLSLVDGKVADFKRLRGGLRFVSELPKTPTGKVARRLLRTLAREEEATAS